MSSIIQFPHPGSEHNKKTGTKWNTGKHKRKFLKENGCYLTALSTKPIEDIVYFWGEWEAPSTVKTIPDNKSPLPRSIFEPYYTLPVPKNAANTDPFVFGNQFHYCICKQGHYTSLRELEKGDMILFGSNLKGHFVLDTVFVIKDWCDYEIAELPRDKKQYNETFYYSSLEPIVNGNQVDAKVITIDSKNGHCLPCNGDDKTDNNPVKDIKTYRIYNALMFEDKEVNGIFSYVPCLPNPTGKKGFERPSISFNTVSQNLNQGIKIIKGENINKAWHEITAEILNKGLSLLIKTDLPQLTTNEEK